MRSEDLKTLQQELTELNKVGSETTSAIATLKKMASTLQKVIQTLTQGVTTALTSAGGVGSSAAAAEIKSLENTLTSTQATIMSDNTLVTGYINSQHIANKLFHQLAAYLVIHNMIAEYDIHGNLEDGASKDSTSYRDAQGNEVTKKSGQARSAHGGRDAASMIKAAIKAYQKKYGNSGGNLQSPESFLTQTLTLSTSGTSLTTASSGFCENELGGIGTDGKGAFNSNGSFATRRYDGYNGDTTYSSLGWEYDDKNT